MHSTPYPTALAQQRFGRLARETAQPGARCTHRGPEYTSSQDSLGGMYLMDPVHSAANQSPLANMEISEQALNAPRKRSQFLKGLMVAGAGVAAAAVLVPAAELVTSH